MDDERTVVDQALDLLVYAPLGLALEAKDMLPKLAERGRGQVALARVAGRFASQRGRREARRFVEGLVGNDRSRTDGTDPGSPERPFDGYDELDAKQVISRLGDLSADQLDAVRRYEEHHRGRSTILNRVQQLQA